MQPSFTLNVNKKTARRLKKFNQMKVVAVIDNNNNIFVMPTALKLRQTTLGRVKDGTTFFKSKRTRQGYKMIKKRKGVATFTSNKSERSYDRPTKDKCFVPA